MNEPTQSGTGSGAEELRGAGDLAIFVAGLIAAAGGKHLLSARAVAAFLIDNNGLVPVALIAEVIAATGGKHLLGARDFGTALIGRNAVDLPSVSLNGNRYYDLSLVGRNDQAKPRRTAG